MTHLVKVYALSRSVCAVCVDGDLRLAEPVERSVTTGLEHTVTVVGPVQYCLNGNLSTVCVSSSGRWGENEVEVACRQLGYQGIRNF